ncbi:hypothetical protein [Hydrobacter penzbergensis]|uniref:hypothetical protein n=1 Tax=Hydrobacter penzbergensis TaxID=1235997 RepID=UPI000B836BE4|nr:hypothetical protein [Hydrobacter penzbergensis]
MIFSLQKDKERRSSLTSLFQVLFKDTLPYLVNTWVAPYALILRLFFTSTTKKTAPRPNGSTYLVPVNYEHPSNNIRTH